MTEEKRIANKYLLKKYIHKLDKSVMLKTQSNYSSTDEFFDSNFINGDLLIIKTVDTKIDLIRIEKVIKDDEEVFKFIVDIASDNIDIRIRSTFILVDELMSLVMSTVDSLKGFKDFFKYAEDLEHCLGW